MKITTTITMHIIKEVNMKKNNPILSLRPINSCVRL